jgi:predicted AAA+ superfamily ATPase
LLLFLFANTGQPFSMQTLAKTLAFPSVTRVSQAVAFLRDAYLLFAVPKHSASFKRRVVAPPKYYAIDNGLRRANSPQTTPDNGHRLENAVALDLLRRGLEPCYAAEKDAWECDFVTEDTLWQICWRLTEANLRREVRGLDCHASGFRYRLRALRGFQFAFARRNSTLRRMRICR